MIGDTILRAIIGFAKKDMPVGDLLVVVMIVVPMLPIFTFIRLMKVLFFL